MSNQTTVRTATLASVWIPIGAGVGSVFGTIYGDITGFTVAGAIIGAVMSILTLIFVIARTNGELSLAQFASGLMLVGAMGFALGAIFVPDHVLLYGVLAIGFCLPAVIWLGFLSGPRGRGFLDPSVWPYRRSPFRHS